MWDVDEFTHEFEKFLCMVLTSKSCRQFVVHQGFSGKERFGWPDKQVIPDFIGQFYVMLSIKRIAEKLNWIGV